MFYRLATAINHKITHLPDSFSRLLLEINCNPALIFGRSYRAYKEFLSQINVFDPMPNLVDTLNVAISNVPYYRNHYEFGVIKNLEDFERKVPFIDRDTVMNNPDEFINDTINRVNYDEGTTGGTSGKPLRLIAPKCRYVVELATMHSLWERVGYRFHLRAVIRNHHLPRGASYYINPLLREIVFDGFRLNESYFEVIYNTIKRFRVPFIHAYPSTAQEFSTFLHRNALDAGFIKAFLSGSEQVFENQLDLIENKLGIRLFNWYGHSEKLILAGYCARSNLYHVEPAYGYFELVDQDGKVIREPGKTGEMVGTTFHNPGMPLIRYRTGDCAEYVGSVCPECGRRVTVIRNIRGRWVGDRIYKDDGSFVTTTALNLHSDLYSVLNGLQYLQARKGELDILVVKGTGYSPVHEERLYRHFRERLGDRAVVRICYVDHLIRQQNGKFLLLISKVTRQGKCDFAEFQSEGT